MRPLELSREKSDQLRDIGVLTSMFFEAAETERRLPPAYRKKPGVAWPDYPDEKVAYGYTDAVTRLSPATTKDIEHYDIAIKLTFLMPEDERKLVWAVAHSAAFRLRGPRWRVLSRVMGIAPATAKRRFERAVLNLWAYLGSSC
jgi:hypothetical protein